MKRVLTSIYLIPLHFYRRVVSPMFPQRCKYYPTCSAYTEQAIRELGIVRGTIVGGWRLLRCNPLSDGGVDMLEDRRLFPNHGDRNRCDHNHGVSSP